MHGLVAVCMMVMAGTRCEENKQDNFHSLFKNFMNSQVSSPKDYGIEFNAVNKHFRIIRHYHDKGVTDVTSTNIILAYASTQENMRQGDVKDLLDKHHVHRFSKAMFDCFFAGTIDLCSLNNGVCIHPVCYCAHGKLIRTKTDTFCQTKAACDDNKCDANVSMCIPQARNHYCFCKNGYKLDMTDKCQDLDECSSGRYTCNQNELCQNTVGSYTCVCVEGYTRTGVGEECFNIDECKEGVAKCHENSFCVNTDSSFVCKCLKGFELKKGKCNDIDECYKKVDNCDLYSTSCLNTPGSYTCMCKDRYLKYSPYACYGIKENSVCALGHNECQLDTTLCVEKGPTYECQCKVGYHRVDHTKLFECVDLDECDKKKHYCHDSTTSCVNTIGTFWCYCRKGLYRISPLRCSRRAKGYDNISFKWPDVLQKQWSFETWKYMAPLILFASIALAHSIYSIVTTPIYYQENAFKGVDELFAFARSKKGEMWRSGDMGKDKEEIADSQQDKLQKLLGGHKVYKAADVKAFMQQAKIKKLRRMAKLG